MWKKWLIKIAIYIIKQLIEELEQKQDIESGQTVTQAKNILFHLNKKL